MNICKKKRFDVIDFYLQFNLTKWNKKYIPTHAYDQVIYEHKLLKISTLQKCKLFFLY